MSSFRKWWGSPGRVPSPRLPAASGAVVLGLLLAGVVTWVPAAPAQPIPTNPQPTATVPPAVFASWFQSGTPTANGVVKAADSVAFPDTPNVSFYQWSWQMFLWLNSPAPKTYGGGDRIFDSPSFFDVSPPDAMGGRTFLPHGVDIVPKLHLRIPKTGPHGLPVVHAKGGKLFEVERPKLGPNKKPIVHGADGKEVEIDHVTLGKDRKAA